MKQNMDFLSFRKWFNKTFSLSLDGKFKGLCTLASVLNFDLFYYRLYKILSGRYRKNFGDVITMHISGHSIKLYNR